VEPDVYFTLSEEMKQSTQIPFSQDEQIASDFALSESIVVYPGDCLDLLKTIPDGALQLVVTSPPTTSARNTRQSSISICISDSKRR